jgi:restriction system protein
MFLDAGFAFFAALPFIVIAVIALWRQRGVPSGARLEAAIEKLRDTAWEDFARALEQGFRREGYAVKRVEGAADLELERAGQRTLVAARRWKASHTGIEPLKELAAAGEAKGAAQCAYVIAGELSENARKFAEKAKIKLLRSADLVKLVGE